MSSGGVFQLITNDGLQDKLIMATDKLRARINAIGCKKLKELRAMNPGVPDKTLLDETSAWMPSLAAIEQTHIVFINSTFKPFVAMAFEYSKTMPKQKPVLGMAQTLNFTMPVFGQFVNDAVVYMKLDNFQAVLAADKVRWIEYVGHRMFKKTTMKLNQVELDSYTQEKYNVHYQFKLPPGKETGWLRNMGQEIPKLGYLTADPSVDEVREYRWFGDGPQTFKTVQSSLELWIPLLFWYKDIQTSLPNFLFPYGQTDIEIELEDEAQLVSYANYSHTTDQVYTNPVITDCALYMNHIYLLPEMHKIFMNKFGFQLVRITKQHTERNMTLDNNSILLHNLKFPVETLFVGFRPVANLSNSQRWYKNSIITSNTIQEAVVTGIAFIQVNNAIFLSETPVVSSLELRAHDIVIYQQTVPSFYNSYLPYRFGPNLKTPSDPGWYMFNFNANPGDYQPSGHFNISRERELVLNYVSAIDPALQQPYIRRTNPVNMYVLAECLNFLLVSDGAAVMRFST